ncbi:glycosyl transferase family protein [Actinomyces sp. Chiba101]|uniref:glycosyltransferase family 2 protein n=2 Tax=Actinomycetaceae TaxID=2049 RepID=UPI000974EE55|nr:MULTISPECIES: glycosyltransferase [Actinomyces]BAW93983.1 glycosyl transferase family protein [Actinomyces sp. Chiba101]GAV93311.1 glycosyl transferase [Actinomyces denticolens]SUU74483.1 Glycosyl transferase family 2 [Actinomyces denticolens]
MSQSSPPAPVPPALPPSVSLVVAVTTYRRNDWLAELLPQLVDQARAARADEGAGVGRARVVVVDNDPDAGAREVVEAVRAASADEPEAAEIGPHYAHEPVPGITAARNRALDEAAAARLLVFIDDDELTRSGWLTSLVRAWRAHGCAAVSGPWYPRFESEPGAWVRGSGVFGAVTAADGAVMTKAGTGNLLLDLDVVRGLGLRFDARYGLSGGEDSAFLGALRQGGGVIRFAAGAALDERVPASRATRPWVLRRCLRSGATWAAVRVEAASGAAGLGMRARYAAKGALRAGRDGALALVSAARRDEASRGRHEAACAGALGMVLGAVGGRVQEYSRGSRLPRRKK